MASPRGENQSVKILRNSAQVDDLRVKRQLQYDSDSDKKVAAEEKLREVEEVRLKEPESPEVLSVNEETLEADEDRQNYLD